MIKVRARLRQNNQRLASSTAKWLTPARQQWQVLTRALDTVSPLATLERGYAVVSDTKGNVLTDAHKTKLGASIRARLAHGELTATVNNIREKK